MPTLSVEVVSQTVVPLSVQPETFKSPPTPVTVTFLLVASVVKVMPVPEAKVKVSVLLPTAISDCPETEIVLKIFWPEPVSELVMVLPETEIPLPAVSEVIPLLVMVSPEMEMPEPAVKESAPVDPCKDKTPLLAIVGFCLLPETVIPDPAVMELIIFGAEISWLKVAPSLKFAGILTLKTKSEDDDFSLRTSSPLKIIGKVLFWETIGSGFWQEAVISNLESGDLNRQSRFLDFPWRKTVSPAIAQRMSTVKTGRRYFTDVEESLEVTSISGRSDGTTSGLL